MLMGGDASDPGTSQLKSRLDYRGGDLDWVDFKIVNTGSEAVKVFNPGNYAPTEGWAFSRESYQIVVLEAFQVWKMALTETEGAEPSRKIIGTKADHVTELPLQLKPGDELSLPIPLQEFYDLKSGISYALEVIYGQKGSVLSASVQFQVD